MKEISKKSSNSCQLPQYSSDLIKHTIGIVLSIVIHIDKLCSSPTQGVRREADLLCQQGIVRSETQIPEDQIVSFGINHNSEKAEALLPEPPHLGEKISP